MIHRKGAQQEAVFPATFIDLVSEVAVKWHPPCFEKIKIEKILNDGIFKYICSSQEGIYCRHENRSNPEQIFPCARIILTKFLLTNVPTTSSCSNHWRLIR
jgi:hypothetical protein